MMKPASIVQKVALAIALFGTLLALAGCQPEKAERDCRGFDHPMLANWMSADVGQSLRLTAQDGETRLYQLVSIADSEPKTQFRYGGEPEDVVCYNTSTHLFESSDGYRIWAIYQQYSKSGESVEQDELNLSISFSSASEITQYNYQLALSDLAANDRPIRYANESGAYYADREYNGIRYMNVIERIKSRDHYVFGAGVDLQTAYSRVVFARSIGFVELERADGKVFSVELE
jgi:hypothetical protein